jgi:cation diffusion facilitator family transporter
MTKQQHNLSYIEGILSIIINSVLFGLKLWVGLLTGSIAIIADAWHTLSDSLSSIIVIVGAKVSSKPPDKQHPFGHGRAEYIASLLIGAFLVVIAVNFVVESVENLLERNETSFGLAAIIVFIISIIFKEAIAQYAFWAGKKINSRSLKADGWHHRTDAIASVIILISIFVGSYLWWLDSVLGIVVALLILYAAITIIKDTARPLLGSKPSEKVIQQIKEIGYKHGVKKEDIHHIHVHEYGYHTELTLHIYFLGTESLDSIYATVVLIQNELRDSLDMEATIHAEPYN